MHYTLSMFDFILNNLSWFWFILAIIFAVIEACTMALTTIWFAIASVIMAFVAFLPIPFRYQLLLFIIISAVLFVFLRKISVQWFSKKKEKTNVEAMSGKTALVTKKITKFEKGEIKVDGIVWTAKTESDTELNKNTECIIERIEGVTAVVTQKK